MREIAMEYYNCQNNETKQWTSELIKLQQIQRLLYQQKNFQKFCQEHTFRPVKKMHSKYKKVVSHNNKYPWNNVTEKNQKNNAMNLIKQGLAVSKIIGSTNQNVELWKSEDLLEACAMQSLPAEKSYYDNYERCFTFEEYLEEMEDIEMSILPMEEDHLSAENLIQENLKHTCNLLNFANNLYPATKPGKVDGNISHINGLACETNRSMYILAVDSIRNHHFAEALGIDVKNKKDVTSVVILDSKHESQYVLAEEYNAKSVREFISNFTRKQLKRTLRTHVEDAAHTHYFRAKGSFAEAKDLVIIDLTTRTFRRTIRTKGVLTLVAVCGGACSAHIPRALSEAARLLSECGVRAQAARLDALRHDLPWHYTPAAYPAILAFPPDRKGEDSSAYPRGARVSTSGLVALALRALPTPLHLRVRLALCARVRTLAEKRACLKDMRESVMTIIGNNLKYWRQTQMSELRESLLRRLQNLNQVYIYLSVLGPIDLKDVKRKFVLKPLDDLSNHWYIDLASILRKNASLAPVTR